MIISEDYTSAQIAKILRDDLDQKYPDVFKGNEECILEVIGDDQYRLKIIVK